MTTQPLPLIGGANASRPQDRETTRLLDLWVSLTQRAAQAAAHDSEDETALRDLQEQVADALIARLPGADDLPIDLVTWEAELVHVADTPPDTCLICRKARHGLSASLPLPGRRTGRR